MNNFKKVLIWCTCTFLFSLSALSQTVDAETAKAEEEKYFELVDQIPGVKKSTSGLRYKLIKEGYKINPSPDIEVCCSYTMYNAKNEILVETGEGNATAIYFKDLIPGFTEGVLLAGESGEIIIWVPSYLGYGENGVPGKVPPYAPHKFEVKVVSTIDGDSL